jgi:integrase
MARSRAAWKAAELAPVKLHTARHTAASVMIAAGVNVKALSEFMGHASITITFDRYGHLLPGSIREAAGLLDAYLDRPREVTCAKPLPAAGLPGGRTKGGLPTTTKGEA